MPYDITTIEDAILDAIKSSVMGGYLNTARSYQGELADAVENVVLRFPAVLVVFRDSTYDKGDHPVHLYNQTMSFSIIVADASLRGEKERRRGGPTSPGTYRMLSDLRAAICGKTFGLDIDPVEIISEESVAQTKRISVYEAVYRVMMDYRSSP